MLRQLGSFRAIWFALLAVSLAVGFLLARRVAKQLYTPVRALMAKAFPQGTSANPRNIQEEYRLITDEVQRTQERSRQFQQELKEQMCIRDRGYVPAPGIRQRVVLRARVARLPLDPRTG